MMPSGISIPFSSPVRGREPSEGSNEHSWSASPESNPPIISVQEARLRDWEDQGRDSPRAVVAGRLGELAIRGDSHQQLPDRSLHQPALVPLLQTNCFPRNSDLHGFHVMPDSQSSATAIERSHPPTDQQSTSTSAANAESQPRSAKASVSPRKSSTSPRKSRTTHAPVKAHSAIGSPPPSDKAVEDPLTWNDSEITGYNPTDPDDDGYGINGIGFKPTAEIAWARSQKRQKQVSEWKNREAREARERRRERRDGNDLDKLRTVQTGGIHKRVKFDV
ncbi:uncharacterized protein BJX67DRAFT_375820 [Aspergillus lucknowensis]|uniref:BZIP domain-containing protein n=1 Tax=Aspergillus lucknowensis TaxID=176173 RepID=A0ABR4L8R9_9EURO